MTRPAFARTHGRLVTAWHCDPPVMSRYSGMECLKIGFFCERRRGFHLHEDLCHVQASRGDGSPAPPGRRASYSSPISSTAALCSSTTGSATAAHCRTSPARAAAARAYLDGRVDDVIELPDGSIVGAIGVSAAVGSVPGVLRFQLVRRASTAFDLELSTIESAAFQPVAEQALAGFAHCSAAAWCGRCVVTRSRSRQAGSTASSCR
jgi:hypothetical protein